MKRIAALVTLAALGAGGLAGCATGGDAATVAARQCGYFARVEGARLLGVDGVETAADGDYKVKLQIEDGMSRRTNAECLYSSTSKQARWAAPLPNGFVRI